MLSINAIKIWISLNIEDYNSKASAYFKQNACLYCIVYGSQGLTFSQVLNSSHSHCHHFSHEKKVSQTLLICISIVSRQQRHGKTTKYPHPWRQQTPDLPSPTEILNTWSEDKCLTLPSIQTRQWSSFFSEFHFFIFPESRGPFHIPHWAPVRPWIKTLLMPISLAPTNLYLPLQIQGILCLKSHCESFSNKIVSSFFKFFVPSFEICRPLQFFDLILHNSYKSSWMEAWIMLVVCS